VWGKSDTDVERQVRREKGPEEGIRENRTESLKQEVEKIKRNEEGGGT
jgi:hypothetical protein